MASGVRLSETRVAIRSPGARPSGESGPDLVDHAGEHAAGPGDRVLHLAAAGDDAEHRGPHRPRPSPPVASRELAERRGVQVQPVHRDPDLVRPEAGLGSSRQAACGSTPAGSSTRCRPSGDPGGVRSRRLRSRCSLSGLAIESSC